MHCNGHPLFGKPTTEPIFMFSILAQAAAQETIPVTKLIALLVFGIVFLLILILRFKLQAFLALISSRS